MATVSGGGAANKILEEIANRLASATEVSAGFAEGAKYPDGTPLATAAASNNYGAPSKGIPPRPFFSNAVTAGKQQWGQQLSIELRNRNYDAREALEAMGVQMAGDIAASLITTNSPQLSEVTLMLRKEFPNHDGITFADVQAARKKVAEGETSGLSGTAAKPLVWTGQMLRYLQGPQAYEVK